MVPRRPTRTALVGAMVLAVSPVSHCFWLPRDLANGSPLRVAWHERLLENDIFSSSQQRSDKDPSDDEDDELDQRRKQAAVRASLLAKRSGNRSKARTSTSVGPRRQKAASRDRQQGTKASLLSDALRKTAQGTVRTQDDNQDPPVVSRVSQSVVQSAIEDLLRSGNPAIEGPPTLDDAKISAAFQSLGRSMGILGDTVEGRLPNLRVGSLDSFQVRLATPADDIDIASLRLSVFSGFSDELQSQFCERSCQAIAARRRRGATCVIAHSDSNAVLGSAECSFHEFAHTRLGRRRLPSSLLYITEVAVNPAARRRGIGARLLQALDHLAESRDIETLYLHVDVTNHAALKLYERAGYSKVVSNDPMFLEFTTSLNLHPGAKGRQHYLLYKDLRPPFWLDDDDNNSEIYPETETLVVGAFGFEIPA